MKTCRPSVTSPAPSYETNWPRGCPGDRRGKKRAVPDRHMTYVGLTCSVSGLTCTEVTHPCASKELTVSVFVRQTNCRVAFDSLCACAVYTVHVCIYVCIYTHSRYIWSWVGDKPKQSLGDLSQGWIEPGHAGLRNEPKCSRRPT